MNLRECTTASTSPRRNCAVHNPLSQGPAKPNAGPTTRILTASSDFMFLSDRTYVPGKARRSGCARAEPWGSARSQPLAWIMSRDLSVSLCPACNGAMPSSALPALGHWLQWAALRWGSGCYASLHAPFPGTPQVLTRSHVGAVPGPAAEGDRGPWDWRVQQAHC